MKKLLLNVLVVFAFVFAASSVNAQGVYNMCATLDIIDTSGTLYDSGGPLSDYLDDEECTLTIHPSCATTITLTFLSFATETNYDYMYIYDGPTVTGTPIVTLNGQTIPPPVTCSSGYMTIHWSSDFIVTNPGWEATWTSVIAPSIAPVGAFTIGNTNPPLNTGVQFTDNSTGGPTTWVWDFGDGDTSHHQNPVHAFANPGTYTVTFIPFTCNESDTVTQTITVQGAPDIDVAQTGFTANAQCGDSVSFPLDVSNIAGGQLVYNMSGSNVGPVKILVMKYGVDQFREWPNTRTALAQNFSNYTLDSTTTRDPGTLNSLLVGKNVLLIPEQETGVTADWNLMGSVIRNFLNNGGSVIWLGSASSLADCMFITGVFSGNYNDDVTFNNLDVVNTTDPITTGVNTGFSAPGATYGYDITNTDKTTLVKDPITNADVVTYRYYGAGKAIFIGFDYYDITVENGKILGQAAAWAGINALPLWINVAFSSDTVNAGGTSNNTVYFTTTGMPAGTYYANLGVSSNDPNDPLINLPCTLTISGFPIIALSDTCLHLGNIMQHTAITDTFQIINNGCDSLLVSSIVSSTGDFTVNPAGSSTLLPGAFRDIVVTFQASTVGTFNGTITIHDNDVDTTLCVTGSTFPAPIVNTSTSSFSQNIPACSQTASTTFDISNTGGSDLTYSISGIPAWMTAVPSSGTIPAGNQTTITLTYNSGTLTGGNYNATLVIISNDPLNPAKNIPFQMAVDFNPCVSYTYNMNTCTGFGTFTSASINTPTTYAWDFGDGGTSNVANPTHSFPFNGTFTVTLIASNASGADTVVQTVTAVITGPQATSCYPVTLAYCSTCGIGVTRVKILDGTTVLLDYLSNDAVDSYQNYTCTAPTATLMRGSTYTFQATTGVLYAETVKAWLDYNNDVIFDTTAAGEKIFEDQATVTHSGTFTVPANAVVHQPLRLRVSSDYTGNPTPEPCLDLQFGQVEDYSIFITYGVGENELAVNTGFSVYPNPYSQSSSIEYNLTSSSNVTVEVFNVVGEKVHSFIADENQGAGKHSYNFTGTAAGVYYVHLTVDGVGAVQKLVKM
jgi:PKD repeat protein